MKRENGKMVSEMVSEGQEKQQHRDRILAAIGDFQKRSKQAHSGSIRDKHGARSSQVAQREFVKLSERPRNG